MMGLPKPIAHGTDDYDTRRVQESTAEAFRQFAKTAPILDGALIDAEGSPLAAGLAFTAGVARDVAHKLNRKARGVIVVDTMSGTPSLPLRDDSKSTSLTTRITFATTCRVKLWVW